MKGKQWLCLSLALLLCIGAAVAEEAEDEDWSIVENVILTPDGQEIPDPTPVEEVTDDTAVEEEPAEYTPRDDFIDRIIALGQEKYEKREDVHSVPITQRTFTCAKTLPCIFSGRIGTISAWRSIRIPRW